MAAETRPPKNSLPGRHNRGLGPQRFGICTSAVPDQFITDVRTPCCVICGKINPFIGINAGGDYCGYVTVVNRHYPLIHQSNQAPYHFIRGSSRTVNERLKVSIHA